MLALRFVCLLALTIWVGGLLVLGAIAAPSIFDVMDARQVADGRLLAGAVFGEILRRFHLLSYGCGAVVLGALLARAVLGPRPMRFAFRAALAAVMLGASAYSGIVVSSRIVDAQARIGAVAPSSLPATDPRRVEFGRLHAASAALQLVPILGGLVLLLWEVRE
jgi:uncharacterized membrane protein